MKHLLFETYRAARLRTIGSLVITREEISDVWRRPEALTVDLLAAPACAQSRESVAAGKVAVQTGRDAATFQISDGRVAPAWCGNATAALVAARLITGSRPDTVLRLVMPNGTVTVTASAAGVGRSHADGIEQSWSFQGSITVRPTLVGGREGVECTWPNPYVLVNVRDDADRADVWRAMNLHALDAKAALIDSRETPARVTFFGVRGEHPTAPITGLLALALTRISVGWVAHAIPDGVIQCPGGTERLPEITASAHHLEARLPVVDRVELIEPPLVPQIDPFSPELEAV